MKPTLLVLGCALVATLAPLAAAEEVLWIEGQDAGLDVGLLALTFDARGLVPEVGPEAMPPPPPPPGSPPPMWEPSHAHEAHHEEPEEEAPAPEAAPPQSEAPPAPLTGLVPIPYVGAGPVPRVDLDALRDSVGTVVPLLPDVAPAYGPAPARPREVGTQAETVAPSAAAEESAVPFAVGVAAVAAAATAAPVASGLGWKLRRLGALALLYSRIAKERLLDHGSRERLLEAVRAEAGASIADLSERTGVPRNTVTYHMRVLEREKLVSSTRQGRHRLYFAPGSLERRHEAERMVALRNDTARTVAAAIAASPGLDQKELCERAGISPSLAHWHARRLVEAGAVDSRREGRSVRYYPVGDALGA